MSIVTSDALKAFAEEVRKEVNGEHHTKTEAIALFQPKGSYITSHQSLTDYLKIADAANTYQPKGSYLTAVAWGDVSGKPSWIGTSKPTYAYSEITGTPTIPTALKSPAALKFGTKSYDGSVAATITASDIGALTSHQDLSSYAKKTDLPSVPTKTSQLTNDSGYLTSHQSLTSYLTKTDAQTLYQPKGSYLTAHQSLADYAKKTDIPTVTLSNGKITIGTQSITPLTSHQDISNLLTKTEASSTYQPKGSYLTAHQSLANYVTIDGAQTISGSKAFSSPIIVSTTAMPLSAGKVTGLTAGTSRLYKDGIAISNPTTPNDLGWIRCLGTGESDTVLEIATGDDGGSGETIVFRGYNTSNAIAYSVSVPKKNGTVALTSDIPSVPVSLKNPNALTFGSKTYDGSSAQTITASDLGALTSHQSLTNYLTKTDASSTYLTKTDAQSTYQPKGNYLTSHQSLANYATKSDISGLAKVKKMTQAQYDALSSKDSNTLYIITD